MTREKSVERIDEGVVERIEERYIVSPALLGKFTQSLAGFVEIQKYPEDYVQTIYFNNPEHELPFEVSFRARRIASSHLGVTLTPNEIFRSEKKSEYVESKVVKEVDPPMELGAIISRYSLLTKVLDNPITIPLAPYVATSYERNSYWVGSVARITIDRDIRYYLMDGLTPVYIATEEGARIEIKYPEEKSVAQGIKRVRDALAGINAEPTIQKKVASYNMLCDHLRSKSNRASPVPETEIEAKLSLDGEHQYVIHDIKRDFCNGLVRGFELLPELSYLLERGKLYRYKRANGGENVRINVGEGFSRTITVKNEGEIVNDGIELGCIIKRHKSEEIAGNYLEGETIGTINRRRKYIVVQKIGTGNTYSIQVDTSTCMGQRLFQLEIEGQPSSPGAEKEAIEDITLLAAFLLKKYPFLSPTKLTKRKWLNDMIFNMQSEGLLRGVTCQGKNSRL